MSAFNRVIKQIEDFIKKYYKNQMVKGGIIFIGTLLFSYLVVSGLEYVGRFSSGVRLGLLIAFIGVNLFLLIKYLAIPILRLTKLGKHLSLMEASELIGKIFPDISDKLKNTLQLNKDKSEVAMNMELVHASIEQRSQQLSVVPFTSGIDISENKRYLKFFLPILLLFISVAVFLPNLFTDGTQRIVYFSDEFIEPAPFEFNMTSSNEMVEGEDYTLEVTLTGDEIPESVKIYTNKGSYILNKKSNIKFVHEFKNVSSDITFYCEANDFRSEQFEIDLLHKALLEDVSMEIFYPKHTGLPNETLQNTGDLTLPEGSIVEWSITASNLDKIKALFKDTSIVLNSNVSRNYRFKRRTMESEFYQLLLNSKEVNTPDTIGYNITVVKDQYPKIAVTETIDSLNKFKRFIEGRITDDYGFSSLYMMAKVSSDDTSYTVKKSLGVRGGSSSELFAYRINIKDFNLKPGQKLEYYFIVTDNDAVNNYKSTSSSKNIYSVSELDELENEIADNDDKLESELSQALKESQELKKKIADLKSQMNNKESLDWKDKQSLESLLKMQENLANKIEELKKDFDENKEEKDQYLDNSEELDEKQQKLQELLNELMDEEMQELFDQLKELMDEMNKDALMENLEEMEFKAEDLEKEMDRTLELFKNMELDQKLENLEEQLSQLSEEQKELSEQVENKEISNEEAKEKQEEIDKKFDEIQEDIEEIKEKNEDLEKPRDLDFDEELEQKTEEEMNNAKESLDKGKEKKASESQSKASEMMKEMAESVASMQSQMSMEQEQEDMDALRYLLENLVTLSHTQEALMGEYAEVRSSDPYYVDLNRRQIDINQATDQVRDSLEALAKRVFQLEGFIMDEVSNLNYNLAKALKFGEERQGGTTRQHQQYAMTSYNNLALMLSEVLDQMQQSAQGKMSGSGSCDNPGGSGAGKPGEKPGSKPGSMSMEQMKQALKDQIEKMKGKNGSQPGGEGGEGKEGEGGEGMGLGTGEGGTMPGGLTPKEIAKMAAQQEQIRESLKKLKEDLNKDGSGFGNSLNELINDIEQQEKDLVNGNIGQNFMKRQEDILTRLLESDKAMRERGFSDERESEEGKNDEEGNPIEYLEYNKKKNAELEFLRSVPVGLQPYYKNLINEYFNAVNE